MTNAEALAATITSLESRLGPESQALIAACESLARAVDESPGRANLWKEYLAVLQTLRVVAGEVEDDGQARLLQLVRPQVGNGPKPGTSDGRTGDPGGDGSRGAAGDALAGVGY